MASLVDRITAPEDGKTDWAAETAEATETAETADTSQMDGATAYQGGGGGLLDSSYDVEVKLIDENSPLYSVKRFEDLGL